MRILLVGNGPATNLASAAARTDVIVQINSCVYADRLPPHRTRYVFLTNTGIDVSERVTEQLWPQRRFLPKARIICARNPLFYTLKKWALQARNHSHSGACQLSIAWKKLASTWPVGTVSFFPTVQLELQLIALGMPRSFLPSTGMVAYDWIRRRLRPGDSIAIEGFTFEGWERHPWEIEKQLVVPVSNRDPKANTAIARARKGTMS